MSGINQHTQPDSMRAVMSVWRSTSCLRSSLHCEVRWTYKLPSSTLHGLWIYAVLGEAILGLPIGHLASSIFPACSRLERRTWAPALATELRTPLLQRVRSPPGHWSSGTCMQRVCGGKPGLQSGFRARVQHRSSCWVHSLMGNGR